MQDAFDGKASGVAVSFHHGNNNNNATVTTNIKKNKNQQETIIKIVSASYGPAGDKLLLTGERSNEESARIPFTRDVTPFLRALLVARGQRQQLQQQQQEQQECGVAMMDESETEESSYDGFEIIDNDEDDQQVVRIGGRRRNIIPLMEGKSMNAIFGDPCPGSSKRLYIHYISYHSVDDAKTPKNSKTEIYRVSFAEHERVILRPRVTFYQNDSKLKHAVQSSATKSNIDIDHHNDPDDEQMLRKARRMGRARSIAEFAKAISLEGTSSSLLSSTSLTPTTTKLQEQATPSCPAVQKHCGDQDAKPKSSSKWRLRSATSEIALPMILLFLQVKERVLCRLVCRVWRVVVRHWGVAHEVDANDPTLAPNFSRKFLRGILAHSQNSLHSLFLCDFAELTQSDLHPAIPHLRKLRSLDISRCNQLNDSTLELLAQHVSQTLEVFYLKGLREVTDQGLISICRSCQKLQVLEISNIPITDEGAICIGQNLPLLSALYMRDNYLLTNRSIDVITENCTRLSQLTLWGCMKLRHLSFVNDSHPLASGGKLVLLNLWGCHSLMDEASGALKGMNSLRSLIVSECHRLTNEFLYGLAQWVPNLHHLHLRYCKKISDEGINSVANSLKNLRTLDMSFCTRVTHMAVVNLLQIRHETLMELRLKSCTQLDVVHVRRQVDFLDTIRRDGGAGRSILGCIRSLGTRSNLSMLDLRDCGGFSTDGYSTDDPFVGGLTDLSFEQKIPGFFVRPNRWNANIQQRLVEQLQIFFEDNRDT